MSIKDELLAIQSANKDGILHCHEVVKWAKENSDSALHSAIEWNNRKAADAHRLWQVRRLIELNITSTKDGPRVVSLSVDRKSGGGYRSLDDVVANQDLYAVMLRDALEELERVQAKYARIEALAEVWSAAETVREKAGVRRRRSVTQEQATAA